MGETDVGKRKGPHALPFSLHKDESFKPGQNNLATQESPCRHLHYNNFIIFFSFFKFSTRERFNGGEKFWNALRSSMGSY